MRKNLNLVSEFSLASLKALRRMRLALRGVAATLTLLGCVATPSWAAPERVVLGNTQVAALQSSADARVQQTLAKMQKMLASQATIRVIVGTRVPFAAEGLLTPAVAAQQRQEIASAFTTLVSKIPTLAQKPETIKRFETIPFLALEVTLAELQQLTALSDVTSIELDELAKPTLAESVPLIGGTTAWSSGYTGAGRTVAVLDTGVDKNHPFLVGKVVSEACYSTTSATAEATSICPGGSSASTATDSALPYASAVCPAGECDHGTHVAGIATGNNGSLYGVAKDATVIAVQVFSKFSAAACGSTSECVSAYDSDIALGLERVYALRGSYAIDAINMSLGGGSYSNQATCDAGNGSTKTAIDNLRSVNIATVIASGNEEFTSSMSTPGCISTAVSVGATWDTAYPTGITCSGVKDYGGVDSVACFSNSVSFLNLLAPGIWTNSSIPGTGYSNYAGTSMAAPHVAGAWALMKQKNPAASVSDILTAFSSSGVNVTDYRNGIIKPRINLPAALTALTTPGAPNTLSVSKPGTGTGTVTSSPAGINCGATCSAAYNSATPVTLAAAAVSGSSIFTGWTGTCTGSETCSVVMDAARSVAAEFVSATPVTGLSLTGLTGATGSTANYSLDVPAGAKNLVVQISGGTGDVDLYVRASAPPDSSNYDCGSYLDGNNETCTFANPQTATYYILLDGYLAYSGVSLTATYDIPTNPNPSIPGAASIGTATAGNASLTVTFTAPTSNGGAAIDSYRATCTGGKTGTGSTSPISVTGLTNGSAYTCTVAAHNSVGYGPESAASNSVTPAASATSGSTFVIVNADPAGVGFNDPTAATPVGGNTGTTLGAQRLIAFQYAADIWSRLLASPVPIRVSATFSALSCTSTSGVLGSAGPTTAFRDFVGAPVPSTWYVPALANALAGMDLEPSMDDISARFNGSIGSTGCLDSMGWYLGLDASPPSGKIDFVSVLLHELGHGLGFLTFVNLSTGSKALGFNDPYMPFLENHGATPADYPSMTDAQRLAASISTGNLHWTGANVKAASSVLSAGKVGDHVQMFAPNPAQSGSSVSHWDTATSPDQLMEPSYTGPLHNPVLELPLFQDIGWSLAAAPATVPGAPTAVTATPGPGSLRLTFTPPTNTGGAPIVSYTATCSATGQLSKSASGSGSPLLVTGLKAGVSYSCSVTASNGSFTSTASVAASAIPKPLDMTPILMLLLD